MTDKQVVNILIPVIDKKVYITQNLQLPDEGCGYVSLSTTNTIEYHPFCDDFGPVNIDNITTFIRLLDAKLSASKNRIVIYSVQPAKRALTNAVFLVGAYMIVSRRVPWTEVSHRLGSIFARLVEPYRDATWTAADFHLTLDDCWKGLERGVKAEWVALPTEERPYLWGKIDIRQYQLFDDPRLADMHEVIPCKIIAFKGPVDNALVSMNPVYHHSAVHYSQILVIFGVTDMICLVEPEYDPQVFEAFGIRFHYLAFPENTAPSASVVRSFLHIIEYAVGLVAVHCRSGLGRTGTLIALKNMFITEFSLKLDPPQSSLRPWHGHRRRSASIGADE